MLKNPNFPIEEEWEDWYSLTPAQRWEESQKLWQFYILTGGSLDPESDTQSPFYSALEKCKKPSDGRSGLRILRRCGV